MGEGGGSVLRISLALAAVKNQPIEIQNIRANRSTPGLKNQHLAAVKCLKELTNADVKGMKKNSEKIFFNPNKIQKKNIDIDIGTAGSTTLILQAAMIPASFAKGPMHIQIKGGTDNPFAPPIDYLKNVKIPILKKIGCSSEVELYRRGHYPKGGGKIRAKINPVKSLNSMKLEKRGKVQKIFGKSHTVKLPKHIAERQAKSAEKFLNEKGYETDIETDVRKKSETKNQSPGTGIVLWAKTKNGAIIGSNCLGEKRKPAEKVGQEAAEKLSRQIKTKKAFDIHMTDQIIPYLCLAHGKSKIGSTKLTSHTMTNIELIKKIIGAKINVQGKQGSPGNISIEGIEISRSDFI